MWNNNEAHFAGDYFFQNQALSTGTAAQVSEAFELGCTEGGIRVRGWLEGPATCASGDTVKVELKVADDIDSTAYRKIAENTITATGTAISGEIFSYIPDVEDNYMKIYVSNATGMTGSFTVAVELVP